MIRVLEIINLPGSAKNFIGGQFKYLHDEGGYEMHLICSPGNGIEEFCLENETHYYPVRLNRTVTPWQDLQSLIKICKYIKRQHIDIVIAHQPKGRLLGMLACMLTRVKHRVIFSHGIFYETMTGQKRRLFMLFEKTISCMATRVVCVSRYVQHRRLEDHIDNPQKQVILGKGSCNGIDTVNKFNPMLINKATIQKLKDEYSIMPCDFIIGFCGRLVKDKGVVELIEAFTTLREKHPDISIKLLIIGSPEKRDGLPQETLDKLSQTKEIICTGKIPFDDIQNYYMLMNVFVLPSHRDGMGMVALEASAMERAVLVSDFTGCAETIIDKTTGLYISKDSNSIVRALEICLDSRYSRQLGRNGRDFVTTNFDHKVIRKHMLLLLKSLLTEE